MSLSVGLLFNGIHGFGLAAERVGMECAWLSEIDPNCNKLMQAKRPHIPNLGDITQIERVPAVDLICGGFPCQDVSVAGQRKGLAGKQSGLWFEFHRIIEDSKPRFVLIENVPGLLSSNKGRDFAVILRGLVECGYGIAWRVLDAQYFGLAQRRKRVFIVGSLGDASAVEVLFEREGRQGHTRKKRTAGETSPTLFASGAGTSRVASAGSEAEFIVFNSGNLVRDANADPAEGLVPALRANPGDAVSLVSFSAGQGAKAGGIGLSEELAPTLKGVSSGSNQVPVIAWNNIQMTSKQNRSRLVEEGTPTLDGQGQVYVSLAPTLSTKNEVASSSTQREKWYDQSAKLFDRPRRLTPLECERLQGFPDGWTEGFSDTTRYKMIGNAVAIPNVVWILDRINKLGDLP